MENESSIQSQIMQYLKQNGYYFFKTIKCNRLGIPDIIVCYCSHLIAIEVKSKKGKLTKQQELESIDIKKAGGFYIIARNLLDFSNEFGIIISKINKDLK